MENHKKIKVCGITQLDQVKALDKMGVNYIGFIHFEKSPRHLVLDQLKALNAKINAKKVLVTVNLDYDKLTNAAQIIGSHHLQLHGEESPGLCGQLKQNGFIIIKAFGINDIFDFKELEAYLDVTDYFLFDYKGAQRGGNGQLFNWDKLKKYPYDIPYFLSGGISLKDRDKINKLKDLKCLAIDINSGFEIRPGLKNLDSVKTFVERLNNNAIKLNKIL